MEKTLKMYIIATDGKRLEQDIPEGLVEIYREKGWKEIPKENTNKSFFNNKKNNSDNNEE